LNPLSGRWGSVQRAVFTSKKGPHLITLDAVASLRRQHPCLKVRHCLGLFLRRHRPCWDCIPRRDRCRECDASNAGSLLKMCQNLGFLLGRDSAHDGVRRERFVAGFAFQALAACCRDAMFDDRFGLRAVRTRDRDRDHETVLPLQWNTPKITIPGGSVPRLPRIPDRPKRGRQDRCLLPGAITAAYPLGGGRRCAVRAVR
jgi:hypothetical protein